MKLETYHEVVLHLLIKQQAELHALRDFSIGAISQAVGADKNKVMEAYQTKVEEGMELTKKQIQKDYIGYPDIDDLLGKVFGK